MFFCFCDLMLEWEINIMGFFLWLSLLEEKNQSRSRKEIRISSEELSPKKKKLSNTENSVS